VLLPRGGARGDGLAGPPPGDADGASGLLRTRAVDGGFVTDAAQLLGRAKPAIDARLRALEQRSGAEVALVILPSIGDAVPKQFATAQRQAQCAASLRFPATTASRLDAEPDAGAFDASERNAAPQQADGAAQEGGSAPGDAGAGLSLPRRLRVVVEGAPLLWISVSEWAPVWCCSTTDRSGGN